MDPTNKFEKQLSLTAALQFAKDERMRKLEADKRRNEQGHTPNRRQHADSNQRKRRRSPSVASSAILTPGRRMQKKKIKMEDDAKSTASSTPSRSHR
jgi:hypothetical protein